MVLATGKIHMLHTLTINILFATQIYNKWIKSMHAFFLEYCILYFQYAILTDSIDLKTLRLSILV